MLPSSVGVLEVLANSVGVLLEVLASSIVALRVVVCSTTRSVR